MAGTAPRHGGRVYCVGRVHRSSSVQPRTWCPGRRCAGSSALSCRVVELLLCRWGVCVRRRGLYPYPHVAARQGVRIDYALYSPNMAEDVVDCQVLDMPPKWCVAVIRCCGALCAYTTALLTTSPQVGPHRGRDWYAATRSIVCSSSRRRIVSPLQPCPVAQTYKTHHKLPSTPRARCRPPSAFQLQARLSRTCLPRQPSASRKRRVDKAHRKRGKGSGFGRGQLRDVETKLYV